MDGSSSHQVAIVFEAITACKQADRELRAREETCRAGRSLSFRDSQTDLRFSLAEREALGRFQSVAALGVGLLKEGKLMAILAVHNATLHERKSEKATLAKKVNELTWQRLSAP